MSKTKTERADAAVAAAEKRVILSMGSRWCWENKRNDRFGGMSFDEKPDSSHNARSRHGEQSAGIADALLRWSRSQSQQTYTPAGLDAFVDHLADGAPVILADMGAGLEPGHA